MASNAKQRTVYAVLQFLNDEANGCTDEDAKESIEVAKQCIETAYGLELGSRSDLELPKEMTLEEMIGSLPQKRPEKELTPEMRAEAEQHKNQGNELMKQERYNEAVSCYTKAILIDPDNSVFYSNRAAAYNKLERYLEAMTDCDEATALNPNYSKAYGRKGLALTGLNRHNEAIEYYKRALELDPTNENLKTNLKLAEEKAAQGSGGGGGMGGMGGLGSVFGGGMPDLGALLNNPNTMNVVSQMMQNPAMMQMANTFMQNMQQQQQQQSSGNSENTTAGGQQAGRVDFNDFMRMGQQFAQQMQQNNPETIENLRNQMGGGGGGQQPPNTDGSSS